MNIQNFYVFSKMHLCVLHGSQNKQRLHLYTAVMPPCKVPQYCYHGGIGRDQQILTSSMLTAQGFSFCRHQQYFNSRYCQLPTLIPGVRFYGSKDISMSTISHSLITKKNIYIYSNLPNLYTIALQLKS